MKEKKEVWNLNFWKNDEIMPEFHGEEIKNLLKP
jgi:hypothetical protein